MSDVYESDEPIHDYFGLTYANYLVLHRTLLQSMPVSWQREFVLLVEELQKSFSHIDHPETFFIKTAREKEVCELTPSEQAECLDGTVRVVDVDDDGEELYDAVYYVGSNEVPSYHRVLIPVEDPIPPYSRGHTRIEPAP